MEEFENENVQTVEETDGASETAESVQMPTEMPEEKEQFFAEEPTDFYEKTLYNEIELSPVLPESEKSGKKGLLVFAICVASVLLLTLATVTGYYFGEKSGSFSSGSSVKLDLASKPKDKDQLSAAQIYEKLNESVVGIRVYGKDGTGYDASGVIYSENGYIITNDHIYSQIADPQFRIYTASGKEYDAKYVAGDSISDIAILKIKDTADKFKAPQFGNSGELVCGEGVAAIGRQNSADDQSSITLGIISTTGCRVQTTSSYSARLIQCDSAVGAGNSGGALVNMYGQVVGITLTQLTGANYDSICFAIPTVTVKRIADQLIADGKVTDRAKLGITYTEIDSVTAKLNNSDSTGLYVVSVGSDSDLSGNVNKGDIITHINGIKITNDDIVLDFLEQHKAGDKIKLTVLSEKGTSKEYEITLKANIGESSYNNGSNNNNTQPGANGGAFNFPSGE